MKRLRFRATWSAEVGAPAGPGVARWDDLLVACGREAALAVEAATGERRWRAAGGDGFAPLGEAVLVSGGARLTCLDARSGGERWSRPLAGPERGPLSAWRLPGGLAALALGPSLGAHDLADGRLAWRFDPPAAGSLWTAPFGAVAVLGADTGLVYGLDAAGGLAWRLRTPGPPAAPPAPWGRDCLLVCRTERGASLLALDPATGRRRWEAPLDFTPTGSPVPFAGLVAVAGHVAGDAVVAAIEEGGAPAFTLAPSLGPGPLALAAARGGLLIKSASGACAAFERNGAARWAHAHEAAHPPPGNLPPLVARGMALVPSEGVEVLDEETGRRLGAAAGLAPVRLLASDDLTLHAIDAEGLVTCARLETHLSVVD